MSTVLAVARARVRLLGGRWLAALVVVVGGYIWSSTVVPPDVAWRDGRLRSTLQWAFDAQAYPCAMLVPLIAALVVACGEQARLAETWHDAAMPRRAFTVSAIVVTLVLVVCAFAVAVTVSFARVQPVEGWTAPGWRAVGREALGWSALVVALVVPCHVLAARARPVGAFFVAIAISCGHYTLMFVPSQGALLLALLPSTSVRVVSWGPDGASGPVVAAAVVSSTVWAAAMASMVVLGDRWAPGAARTRRTVARPPRVRARSVLRTVAAVAVVVVVVGSGWVAPRALTVWLPWENRPSHLLQVAAGTDPASRAEDFFDDVWSGRRAAAESSLARGAALPGFGGPDGDLLVRPATVVFYTTDVVAGRRATVQVEAASGHFSVCMVRQRHTWLVGRIDRRTTCS